MQLVDIPYFTFAGKRFNNARVAKVYDGDSVTIVVPIGRDNEMARLHTRLLGVDACEIRGADRDHGRAARRDLVDALRIPIDERDRYDEVFFQRTQAFVDVVCYGGDKYGRELVDICPCGSASINKSLCESSPYFAAYDGTGARPSKPIDDAAAVRPTS